MDCYERKSVLSKKSWIGNWHVVQCLCWFSLSLIAHELEQNCWAKCEGEWWSLEHSKAGHNVAKAIILAVDVCKKHPSVCHMCHHVPLCLHRSINLLLTQWKQLPSSPHPGTPRRASFCSAKAAAFTCRRHVWCAGIFKIEFCHSKIGSIYHSWNPRTLKHSYPFISIEDSRFGNKIWNFIEVIFPIKLWFLFSLFFHYV